ncbi:MAG: nucleoside-triphosphatase [Caldisericia bacterium]
MKIFITGEVKVGKTTLIKEISEILIKSGYKISGFITTDVLKEGKRVGFNIIDIVTKEERLFASKLIKTEQKFGSYYLNIKNLDKTLENILKREYDFLIIDEIGKMEFYSKIFIESIENIVKKDINLLATLHRDFIVNYQNYGIIYVLTLNNREKIKNEILKIVKKECKK